MRLWLEPWPAALPYIDDFVEGHCLDSLQELAELVLRGSEGRSTIPVGSERMKELLDDLDRWHSAGVAVAMARVVDLEGSGPRLVGAAMAVTEDGEVSGSVSGGCVEGAVVVEALEVLATGERRMVRLWLQR